MRFIITIAAGICWASMALAQSTPVVGTLSTQNTIPIAEQTRLNTLINNVNTLVGQYNDLQRAYNRYTRCANLGMGYAPNSLNTLPGRVSDTGCVPLPNKPLAREIILTTATADGNDMSGFGSTVKARIEGFMNANGCPTSKWRPCTDHEIRYLYSKYPMMFSRNVTSSAWFMGIDAEAAARFSTTTPVSNPYCSGWTSTAGHGYLLTYDDGGGRGMTYGSCSSAHRVACCR